MPGRHDPMLERPAVKGRCEAEAAINYEIPA